MRPDVVRADRFHEVREAARGWHRGGAIDAPTLARIETLYPDDRQRLGAGLRVLAWLAMFFGGQAAVAFVAWGLDAGATGFGLFALTLSVGFALATEYQLGPLRRAQAGAEHATAVLSCALAWVGTFLVLVHAKPPLGLAFTLGSLAFALGAWRWGFASLAAIASAVALLALSCLYLGRVWWAAACVAVLPFAWSRAREERWAPAHRRCLKAVAAVALIGLYVAVHYDGVRGGALEWVGDRGRTWHGSVLVIAAILTAIVPLAVIVAGVRRRDRTAIILGVLMLGVSVATLRLHYPWAPMWFTLTAGGTACFVAALALRRALERALARAWRGITADPLFDDPRAAAALRVAATISTLGPSPHAPGERPFEGGGGESGGGGAQGRF